MTLCETYLDRFNRDYPGYLPIFDRSDSWKAAARKASAFSKANGYTGYDLLDNSIIALYLTRWKQYRPVYSMDKTISRAFWDQAVTMDEDDELPTDLLLSPPYPVFEIDGLGIQGTDGSFTGRIIAGVDCVDGDWILSTFWERGNGELATRYLPLLPGKTLGDCRRKLLADFHETGTDATLEEATAESLVVLYVVQVLLYIQSRDPDIQRRPSTTKSKSAKKPPRIMDVGYRIGRTIRAASAAPAEHETRTAYPDSRRSPIPHTRRGHWHRFRTGKRDDPSTWKYTVQWIPPIFVGGKHDPATTIINVK